ncbi:MAG: permease [Gaiellaceae bacterium]|nr:permease [Gaiellaceae bacterium]
MLEQHSAGKAARILVVANETVATDEVRYTIDAHAEDLAVEILVVAPALTGRLAFWTSADTEPRRAAEERLGRCLESLHDAGLDATGYIGDADPLLAIADALCTFDADRIIIATHPDGRSHWLERGVVEQAEYRFSRPVDHVVASSASGAASR